jgi:hypothetical protein
MFSSTVPNGFENTLPVFLGGVGGLLGELGVLAVNFRFLGFLEALK